jgi:hypothetical protein
LPLLSQLATASRLKVASYWRRTGIGDAFKDFIISVLPDSSSIISAQPHSKELRGDFDLADEKIYIEGEVYSVSGGGSEAKKRLTGKDGMATNGWQFWRYSDESGEERFIEDLRPSTEENQ